MTLVDMTAEGFERRTVDGSRDDCVCFLTGILKVRFDLVFFVFIEHNSNFSM